MNLTFKRATRANVPLKIGISGPSGSGKTTAALRIARGLVGPNGTIALLDTENRSASLYFDLTPFDSLDMNPPYQVAKFLAAIDAAVEGGYQALIIDSASHEWKELLAEKEALDARGGNSYTNWGGITKKHETFLAAIRNAPIHLVLCLRAKDKHEITEKDGKKSVVKLGQGSEMRDGFEYELTLSFDLAMDHSAKTSKDRTRIFDGRMEPLTESTGRELSEWITSGKTLAKNTGTAFENRAPEMTEKETREALTQMVQDKVEAAKTQPVSQEASDFVDGVAWATAEECVEITDAAVRGKVDLAKLAGYLHKRGYMPDPKNWTRISREGWKKVLPHLTDDDKRRALIAFLDKPAASAA